jgi:hypothetical protein
MSGASSSLPPPGTAYGVLSWCWYEMSIPAMADKHLHPPPRRKRGALRQHQLSCGWPLRDEDIPHQRRRPPRTSVGPGDELLLESIRNESERHPVGKQGPNLDAPSVIHPVAEPVCEPNVIQSQSPAVHLEPRIVVGGELPVRWRTLRPRVERLATFVVIAMRHLTTNLKNLLSPGHVDQDAAGYTQPL